jgi:hypothetical protein
MITEAQRLQMLSILAHTTTNSDEVLKKAKELYGIELTKQQLDDYINNLRKVRGR